MKRHAAARKGAVAFLHGKPRSGATPREGNGKAHSFGESRGKEAVFRKRLPGEGRKATAVPVGPAREGIRPFNAATNNGACSSVNRKVNVPYEKRTPSKGCPQKMAERKGLEPSTSGVTGRRYNRLNYRSAEVAFRIASFA